ncbi:small nuclear ribonucleoprotein-associated protein N-like [Lucilia sericata]|uniref:small nuclear ribonucleoprotein-associated protein N-like n=1 Tax=Lucilia sericata TaxID=13632 RepID=UPI0018A7F35D|nr:small nuclear ribonucleoprotein-associated protein N-like isoform X8 [Lucilia sericata]XP_037826076.1 small nuclear ribonucleoprotein-associated protein N-like isoform X4 [Lucilia sericata]XP_037826188.1 small nuclear ribonucleoprotein-associated protein N-like [Lucilia sericata]
MDGFIIGLSIGCTIFVITSAVVLIRRRKRNNRYPGEVIAAPVVVTSATHTAPGGYPVTQMPVGATTTAYPSQAYAAPYPPQGAPTQMPMPMPMPAGQPPVGMQPHLPPYPATNMNPPPYDVAVNCAGAGQVNNTGYQKQAPYNPNYPM